MSENLPPLLTPKFDTMPAELTDRAQWVVWRAVWLPEKGKYSKIPMDAKNGKPGSTTDPKTWADFETARAAYENNKGKYAGVGFVLSEEDPFAGVDLDHAVHEREVSADARAVLDSLNSYAEISPSGTGLRVFVQAALPPGGRKRGDVEMYENGRFLTVTGRRLPGPATVEKRQDEITAFHAQTFPPAPPKTEPRERAAPVDLPLSGGHEIDDSDLLQVAMRAKNGAKIAALYAGNTAGYPGASEADLALCTLLAFYSGGDAARLDNWFRASVLMRDKWDEPHYSGGETYGEHTIQKAIDAQNGQFYTPKRTQADRQARPAGTGESGGGNGQSDISTFALTDLGNAERLLHHHGQTLRYNGAWGWLCWDGKRWRVDDTGEVFLLVEAVVRKIPLEAAALAREAANLPDGDTDRRDTLNKKAQALLQWAIKSEAAPRINACAELAKHQPGIPASPSAFDAAPFLLNVQNGLLNLKTGELMPHDPAALCSKICPVDYKPNAAAPLWEKCLERWQPDADVRAFLARAAGYTLTGDTGEETAFLLYGVGRNGKSKFTSALEYILGDYAGRAPIEIFMQGKIPDGSGPTPDKANLAGLRFVVASEIMQARRFNEAFVKDVTGGDKITAAHKHMKPFTFKPLLKLWLYGNHKPIISGADEGIKARLPLVPFTVIIPKADRDTELDAKLQAEAEGILVWAVRGCMEWQKQRLSPPAAVVEASDAYHDEMDVLHGFFKTCCIFGEGKQIWTPSAELRNALTEWARGEVIDERSLPKPNEFAERLRREGCDDNGGKPMRVAGKLSRCWSNVRLRTDADPADEPENQDATSSNQSSVTPVTPVTPKTVNSPMKEDMEKNPKTAYQGVTGVTIHVLLSRVQANGEPLGEDARLINGCVSLVENGFVTAVWDGRSDGKPRAFGVSPWLPVEPYPVPADGAYDGGCDGEPGDYAE